MSHVASLWVWVAWTNLLCPGCAKDQPKSKMESGSNIRALVSVLEGRGTKLRIKTEFQYLVDLEWNRDVKCISSSEFLVCIPSKAVMTLLNKMGKIKFITADILAVVEETNLDPDVF